MRQSLYASVPNSCNNNSEWTLIRILYIAAMICSSIESNNPELQQIERIEVNSVAQVPPHAIWLWRQQKTLYHSLDFADRGNLSISDAEKRLMMVVSIMEGLHQRWMLLLDKHHTCSPLYQPCWKYLNHSKKHFNARFNILDNGKTHQLFRNECSSQHRVVIRTDPHPELQSIKASTLMCSQPCGPCGTNHMNCRLVVLNRQQRKYFCVLRDVFCIMEMTDILVVIEVACEVSKCLEPPSNVTL